MKYFFLFFLIFTKFCFAQDSNAIVATYKLSFIVDEKIQKNPRALLLFDEINKGASLSGFNLVFNKTEANFLSIPYRGLGNENREQALIMADFENTLYIDSKSNLIFYNNSEFYFSKNKYLIKKEVQENWMITSDTMSINGMKCLKAVLKEEVINSRGIKSNKEVVAWFAPELPYKFGPNGYGNLPGLIVQLQSDRVAFYLDKINFTNDTKIEKIVNGELISETEYEKELFKASEKMRGF